jgi:hypothetical protein
LIRRTVDMPPTSMAPCTTTPIIAAYMMITWTVSRNRKSTCEHMQCDTDDLDNCCWVAILRVMCRFIISGWKECSSLSWTGNDHCAKTMSLRVCGIEFELSRLFMFEATLKNRCFIHCVWKTHRSTWQPSYRPIERKKSGSIETICTMNYLWMHY